MRTVILTFLILWQVDFAEAQKVDSIVIENLDNSQIDASFITRDEFQKIMNMNLENDRVTNYLVVTDKEVISYSKFKENLKSGLYQNQCIYQYERKGKSTLSGSKIIIYVTSCM